MLKLTEKLSPDEYRVYLIKLPPTIHGAVREDENGFPSIYINDDLSPQAQKAAFLHEMRHILRGDLYNDLTIEEAERK
jgi:Zn-dependent peptidase ImmA (M78 family)